MELNHDASIEPKAYHTSTQRERSKEFSMINIIDICTLTFTLFELNMCSDVAFFFRQIKYMLKCCPFECGLRVVEVSINIFIFIVYPQ